MKNRIVGAGVFVSCVALGLVACEPMDTTTVDNADTGAADTGAAGVTLDNSEKETRKNSKPEDIPFGGEIIDANYIPGNYRYLGEVQEFTAELANGRVVQCLTWGDYGNRGSGVTCDWDSDGAPGSSAVTETVTVTDTP